MHAPVYCLILQFRWSLDTDQPQVDGYGIQVMTQDSFQPGDMSRRLVLQHRVERLLSFVFQFLHIQQRMATRHIVHTDHVIFRLLRMHI